MIQIVSTVKTAGVQRTVRTVHGGACRASSNRWAGTCSRAPRSGRAREFVPNESLSPAAAVDTGRFPTKMKSSGQ